MALMKGFDNNLMQSAQQCRQNPFLSKKCTPIEFPGFRSIALDGERHFKGRKYELKLAMRGLSVEEPVVDQDFMEELNKVLIVLTTPPSLHKSSVSDDVKLPIASLKCKVHVIASF